MHHNRFSYVISGTPANRTPGMASSTYATPSINLQGMYKIVEWFNGLLRLEIWNNPGSGDAGVCFSKLLRGSPHKNQAVGGT